MMDTKPCKGHESICVAIARTQMESQLRPVQVGVSLAGSELLLQLPSLLQVPVSSNVQSNA